MSMRENILRLTAGIISKEGFEAASMRAVCKAAGVTAPTLYHYFADKDEIVTMVADFHMASDQKKYDEMRSASKNAIEELVKISTCLKRDFQKMNPALLFDLQKYHAKAWLAWLSHKQKYIKESVMRNLKQGIEEGFFRSEMNVSVLAVARLELIQLTFDNRAYPPEQFNLAEVSSQLFEHFVYGLLTDKGRKAYEKYKQQTNSLELIPQSI